MAQSAPHPNSPNQTNGICTSGRWFGCAVRNSTVYIGAPYSSSSLKLRGTTTCPTHAQRPWLVRRNGRKMQPGESSYCTGALSKKQACVRPNRGSVSVVSCFKPRESKVEQRELASARHAWQRGSGRIGDWRALCAWDGKHMATKRER